MIELDVFLAIIPQLFDFSEDKLRTINANLLFKNFWKQPSGRGRAGVEIVSLSS